MRLNHVIKYSSYTFLAKVIGTIALFLLNLYIAKISGAAVLGIFAIGTTFLSIVSVMSRLGVDSIAERMQAQYMPAKTIKH